MAAKKKPPTPRLVRRVGNDEYTRELAKKAGYTDAEFDEITSNQTDNPHLTIKNMGELAWLIRNKVMDDKHIDIHGKERDALAKSFNIDPVLMVRLHRLANTLHPELLDMWRKSKPQDRLSVIHAEYVALTFKTAAEQKAAYSALVFANSE